MKMRAVACTFGVTLALAATALAAPTIDGRYDPGEGYTSHIPLILNVEGGAKAPDPGDLYTYQDPITGDVSLLMSQPVTLVDNTYGANSIGWGAAASSGKDHNFKDLVGSDKAQFAFTDGQGNTVLDIVVDYISETSKGSGVYVTNGVLARDGEVITGSASDVLEWGTSLDYNFNTLGHNTFTTDSPLSVPDYSDPASAPGWIFEVIYEIKVDGALFAQNGFGVAVPVVHDSPNKVGKNKVYPDPGDLCIIKYEDLDRDGEKDLDEILLPDWEFLVEGPESYSMLVTTDPLGSVTLTDLEPGAYTITEIGQAGWTITTDNPLYVTVDAETLVTVEFGNHKTENGELIPEPTTGLLGLLGLIALKRRRA